MPIQKTAVKLGGSFSMAHAGWATVALIGIATGEPRQFAVNELKHNVSGCPHITIDGAYTYRRIGMHFSRPFYRCTSGPDCVPSDVRAGADPDAVYFMSFLVDRGWTIKACPPDRAQVHDFVHCKAMLSSGALHCLHDAAGTLLCAEPPVNGDWRAVSQGRLTADQSVHHLDVQCTESDYQRRFHAEPPPSPPPQLFDMPRATAYGTGGPPPPPLGIVTSSSMLFGNGLVGRDMDSLLGPPPPMGITEREHPPPPPLPPPPPGEQGTQFGAWSPPPPPVGGGEGATRLGSAAVKGGDDGEEHDGSAADALVQLFVGLLIALSLLALGIFWLSAHIAGEEKLPSRGDPELRKLDGERESLSKAILDMPRHHVSEVQQTVDKQRRQARLSGGGVPLEPSWTTHRAPDGRRYYVDASDGTATWQVPAELAGSVSWDHRKKCADQQQLSSAALH